MTGAATRLVKTAPGFHDVLDDDPGLREVQAQIRGAVHDVVLAHLRDHGHTRAVTTDPAVQRALALARPAGLDPVRTLLWAQDFADWEASGGTV
jgi:hypothetical protein